MAVAKALGASRIIAVDIIDSRLKFAKEYAATDIFVPPKREDGEDSLKYSRRSSDELKRTLNLSDRGRHGVDLVIDASGAEVSIQTAFYTVKVGGRIVQVSISPLSIDVVAKMRRSEWENQI